MSQGLLGTFAVGAVITLAWACSSSSDRSENAGGDSGAGGASSAGQGSGGQTSGGANAGGSSAGGVSGGSGGADGCGCVTESMSWRRDGGFVAYVDTSLLGGCRTFTQVRQPAGISPPTNMCNQEIACGSDPALSAIAQAIESPDVQAALTAGASTPVLYGHDSRPVDGQVLRIEFAGSVIEVGSDCNGAANCTDIPEGVALLASLLVATTTAQLEQPPCSDVF